LPSRPWWYDKRANSTRHHPSRERSPYAHSTHTSRLRPPRRHRQSGLGPLLLVLLLVGLGYLFLNPPSNWDWFGRLTAPATASSDATTWSSGGQHAGQEPLATAQAESRATSPPHIELYVLERQIHDMINVERVRAGFAALEWSDHLWDIARSHSEDMALRSYFDHTSPEGQGLADRYRDAGFPMSRGGAENIFTCSLASTMWYTNGRLTSTDYYSQDELAVLAVEGWMNSPGHRKNILTPAWQMAGVGSALTADLKLYFTQNFG